MPWLWEPPWIEAFFHFIVLSLTKCSRDTPITHFPMLRYVANDMNRWEIFPSLLIGTSIYIYILLFATFWQHCVAWEKMHFTWFSRGDGVFSHSSPNPALAATRLWAGYGELVGENSISPGKPCKMHIIPSDQHQGTFYLNYILSSSCKKLLQRGTCQKGHFEV